MLGILIQFLLPFIIAALVVVGVTIIAEKFGTKLGGILGTVPSTIVVAFVFISLNRGEAFASRAATVVPAEMAINLAFLFIFSILVKRSFWLAVGLGLLVWAMLSTALLLTNLQILTISVIIFCGTIAILFVMLEFVLRTPSSAPVKVHYTPTKLAIRGLFAGFIIGVTVLLSNVGEVISGIFSVFPAIFLSTMVITYREHGAGFSSSIGKSMLLGSQTVAVYAIAVHFLYPWIGTLLGSLAAYGISMLVVAALLVLRNRIS